jgi:hypothetical protein
LTGRSISSRDDVQDHTHGERNNSSIKILFEIQKKLFAPDRSCAVELDESFPFGNSPKTIKKRQTSSELFSGIGEFVRSDQTNHKSMFEDEPSMLSANCCAPVPNELIFLLLWYGVAFRCIGAVWDVYYVVPAQSGIIAQ